MKIKNLKINGSAALAPMAGVADRAFRELCAYYGAAYTVSEMVSSKGLYYNDEKSKRMLKVDKVNTPFGIQLFGDDPLIMHLAVKMAAENKPDFIDINMGCPVPKVVNNGGGSALMKKPKLCGEIVKAAVEATNLPITVKLRKGWDLNSINAVEVAKTCEENGASAVAVHGRTKDQYYLPGVIDYKIIKEVKDNVNIPVIGNGDVCSGTDWVKIKEETNCDMVMIGRGALGKPWIFKEIDHYIKTKEVLTEPSNSEKINILVDQIEKACKYKGEYVAMKESRKHASYYLKGFRNASDLRRRTSNLKTLKDLYDFKDYVNKMLKEEI